MARVRIGFEWVLALILFATMLLTVVDVIGRYAFASPVTGGYEITELAMGILVFGALPLVTERREHLCVELFTDKVRGAKAAIRDTVSWGLSIVVSALIAIELWKKSAEQARDGTITLLLALHTAPFVVIIAVLATVNTIILTCLLLTTIKGQPLRSTSGSDSR